MAVTDEAIGRIKEMIVSGVLRPGDRLPKEADLATQLGLSRNSLREAVRALSLLNILHVRQGDGTYVSSLNDCYFCQASHGACASHHLGDPSIVQQVKRDFQQAPISEKLKSLLIIAGKVQQGGKQVGSAEISASRAAGATDMEIHDTVLIAAAFCMYNRYVDGLATWQPTDEPMYTQMGRHLATEGYRTPSLKASAA